MTVAPSALAGVRVIEMGQLIAGPFAGKTLGDFGADVIKIEAPGSGDPLRNWRLVKDGTSVWWQVQSRNKRSIALDLRSPEGQAIARRLIAEADVLVENFRPGTLEGWGMSYEELSKLNPGLVMLRVSGYGQTGPYRDMPGFGVIGEAMGGLRHLTAEPGRVPVRCGHLGRPALPGARCRPARSTPPGNMIIEQTTRDGDVVEVPGIVPKLLGTPGGVRRAAPGLGNDTDAVLRETGFTDDEIAALRSRNVVA